MHFTKLACVLEERQIPRERIIYITHWALQPNIWQHLYDGVSYSQFLRDVSNSAIVCVSHFMAPQFRFYSNVCVQAIPHYVPADVFGEPTWRPGGREFINVVNKFYQNNRGVGADFWDSLDFVEKKLYGADNGERGSGPLQTVSEFREAVSRAAGYLWTADAVAISFAPLEAMVLGCPVVAPKNLDWPMFFDDRVNIVLYEERNYEACKEAVAYLRDSATIASDIACRGRDAVLRMNNASLFRERWSRVIDAAGAAATRGRRRLASTATEPLSNATSVRLAPSDAGRYSLMTSMVIGGRSVSISHPAEMWNLPRQFIHKYQDLSVYAPAKYELVKKASRSSKVVFDIGRDLGYYGYAAAEAGASVNFFNRSVKISQYIAETISENDLDRAAAVDVIFDRTIGETWLSPSHAVDRGALTDRATERRTTTTIDDYVSVDSARLPDLLIIDDPSHESNILRGAEACLRLSKPDVIVNCYKHAAYAKGAPSRDLITMLIDLGYSIEVCDWNAEAVAMVELIGSDEPEFDVFLLYASHRAE